MDETPFSGGRMPCEFEDSPSNEGQSKLGFADLIEQALAKGAKLSITAKTSKLDFSENELTSYASVGKYVSEIARLEYDLDDFCFLFAKFFPKLALSISRNVPVKIDEKAAFFCYAHVLYPKLREIGDPDGMMDLKYLYYGLIELFNKRNSIIHGTIVFAEHIDNKFLVSVRKYKRLGKNRYDIEEAKYGSDYLERAMKDAHYISTFIWRAKKAIEGTVDLWKERDEFLRGQVAWRFLQKNFPELVGI
jgi:hypothetical protein